MRWIAAHRAALVVFLLALLPGLALTVTVHNAAERRASVAFDRTAELAVDRVVSRVRQHVVALRASRGLWDAREGRITREEFARFVASLDVVNELSGARGIGFAPMIPADDMPRVESAIRQSYGVTPRPPVATEQPWRTPVLLVEPANELTLPALGYDMYSDPTRRAAMNAALADDAAHASAPVTLVGSEEEGGANGFLIYLPLLGAENSRGTADPPTAGFVYAAFSGQDLIEAALASGPPLPATMDVADATDLERLLHQSDEEAAGLTKQLRASILGRDWVFNIRQTGADATGQLRAETFVLGALSLVFALAMAYAVASRQGEAARARELAAAAAREADYREMLVQEMKHRIKNHIARIQSIARQSARGAKDVKAFTDSFEARLRSMAAVQEILAGTAQPQADVGAIVRKELQQGLDVAEADHVIEGPVVRLDERKAHSFGLVVHELVTNAMKYGGLSAVGQGLKVIWAETALTDGKPGLVLDWEERFVGSSPTDDVPKGTGFGSRLIEASLKGELSGTLVREFHPSGLRVRIAFPIEPTPQVIRSQA
jgi:CHASE1-domain containing sensor protein/two-component sensor histidine kinase